MKMNRRRIAALLFLLLAFSLLMTSCTRKEIRQIPQGIKDKTLEIENTIYDGVLSYTKLPYTPGQVITFGKYEQNGDTLDETEDLEWVIFRVFESDGKYYASMITKDIVNVSLSWGNGIDLKKVTYNTSYLYAWCDRTFYNQLTASDIGLHEKIACLPLACEGISGGKDGAEFEAKAFLPSYEEIEKYFVGDLAQYKQASVCKKAEKDGVKVQEIDGVKYGCYYVRNLGDANPAGGRWASGYMPDGSFSKELSMVSEDIGIRVCVTICISD
jgi:hypothetical protein